jgi:hypothetical protein
MSSVGAVTKQPRETIDIMERISSYLVEYPVCVADEGHLQMGLLR